MRRAIEFLIELVGVGGVAALLVFVTWTKVLLGAFLAFLGAFFPSLKDSRQQVHADAHISFRQLVLKVTGSVRVAVIAGGLILIVGGLIDAHDGYPRNGLVRAIAATPAEAAEEAALKVWAKEEEERARQVAAKRAIEAAATGAVTKPAIEDIEPASGAGKSHE
jgi:hypothetical protein